MKCPFCGEHSTDMWFLLVDEPGILRASGIGASRNTDIESTKKTGAPKTALSVDYMYCANFDCGELIMRVHETRQEFSGGGPIPLTNTETWLVRPRWGNSVRNVDPDVPEAMRKDFQEAAVILDFSPKMSAVMSRRILADLLEEYAGRHEFLLGARLENFAQDDRFPLAVRQNAQALNEAGKLGAHTKKNDQAEIIDVDRDEAEWTLGLVERFFEIFIIAPNRDAVMRKQIEAKSDSVVRPEKRKES